MMQGQAESRLHLTEQLAYLQLDHDLEPSLHARTCLDECNSDALGLPAVPRDTIRHDQALFDTQERERQERQRHERDADRSPGGSRACIYSSSISTQGMSSSELSTAEGRGLLDCRSQEQETSLTSSSSSSDVAGDQAPYLGALARIECDPSGMRDGVAASGRTSPLPRTDGLLCPTTPTNQPLVATPATGSWQRRFREQGWAPTLQIPPNHAWAEAGADISIGPAHNPLSVSGSGPVATGVHPSTPVIPAPHLSAPAFNAISPRSLQLDDVDLDIMDGVADISSPTLRSCHPGRGEHDLRRAAIFNQTTSRLSPRPPSRLSQSRPGRIFTSDEQLFVPSSQPPSPSMATLHMPGQAGVVLQSSPVPPPASLVRAPPFLPHSPASPLPSSTALDGHPQLPLPLFNNRHAHSTPASPAGVAGISSSGAGASGGLSATPRYGLHGASPLSPQRGLHPLPVTPTAMQRPRSQAALRDSTEHGTPPHRRFPAEWMNQSVMMLMPNRLREVADIAATAEGWRSPVVSSSSSNSSPRLPLEAGVFGDMGQRREGAQSLLGLQAMGTAVGSNPAARAAAVLSAPVAGSSASAPAASPPPAAAPSIRGSIRLSPGWHCYGQGIRHSPTPPAGAPALSVASDVGTGVADSSGSSGCTALGAVQQGQLSAEQQLQAAAGDDQQRSAGLAAAGHLTVPEQPQQTQRAGRGRDGWCLLELLDGAADEQSAASLTGSEGTGIVQMLTGPRSLPTSPGLQISTAYRSSPLSPLGGSWVSPGAPDVMPRQQQQGRHGSYSSSSAVGGANALASLGGCPAGLQLSRAPLIPPAVALLAGEQGAGRGALVLQRQALLGVPQPPPGFAGILADDRVVNEVLQGLPGVNAGDPLVVAMVEALRPNDATRFVSRQE